MIEEEHYVYLYFLRNGQYIMRSAKDGKAESLPVNASLEGIICASHGTLAKWSAYSQEFMDGVSGFL